MHIIVLSIKFKVSSVFVCDNGLRIVEANSLIHIISDAENRFPRNYI